MFKLLYRTLDSSKLDHTIGSTDLFVYNLTEIYFGGFMSRVSRINISKIFQSAKDELLLYSGQYALFYILMNLSKDRLLYFSDFGHTALIFILIVQTIFLINYGKSFWGRLLGSLIAPLFYTILEFKIDLSFLLGTAHVMFWFFSFTTGIIQALQLRETRIKQKRVFEYTNTFINILIFIFMYFYLDLYLTLTDKFTAGGISYTEYGDKLKINSISEGISIFLTDSAHVFLIVAGLLLAISLGAGRIKVLELTEKIKTLFGRYVDEDIRDRIIIDGRGKSEKVNLSVFFIDIRNFTSISENHKPEEITEMLNIFFNKISREIHKNNGIIDKYIGDAAMAVFGLEHNSNACSNSHNCAKAILSALPSIKEDLSRKKLPVLNSIGIGIHYGPLIAGDIGSDNRVNYTFIGDTVNIASRLESYCKELKSDYLISSNVYNLLEENQKADFTKESNPIFVKGKVIPLEVYNYKANN